MHGIFKVFLFLEHLFHPFVLIFLSLFNLVYILPNLTNTPVISPH